MITIDLNGPGRPARPVATFTMGLGPGDWKPGPAPAAGDLVLLYVFRPDRPVIVAGDGWTAAGEQAFWKIWGPGERAAVTFAAEGPDWEVEAYAFR